MLVTDPHVSHNPSCYSKCSVVRRSAAECGGVWQSVAECNGVRQSAAECNGVWQSEAESCHSAAEFGIVQLNFGILA